jgi:triosephosphate isomerase
LAACLAGEIYAGTYAGTKEKIMAARRPLIAGNWKMYGRVADLAQISATFEAVGAGAKAVDIVFCLPAQLIALAAKDCPASALGGQDCAETAADAAQTGDISAAMLADVGAGYVIVGHSERRAKRRDDNESVRLKAEAALAAGLQPIICVGETAAERASGRAEAVVAGQVAASLPTAEGMVSVAYEPVWAIGGDRTPTLEEIAAIHRVVRQELAKRYGPAAEAVRVLYGGSVNPKNARDIFAVEGVDGALVGRASLKSADFAALIMSHPRVAV